MDPTSKLRPLNLAHGDKKKKKKSSTSSPEIKVTEVQALVQQNNVHSIGIRGP